MGNLDTRDATEAKKEERKGKNMGGLPSLMSHLRLINVHKDFTYILRSINANRNTQYVVVGNHGLL